VALLELLEALARAANEAASPEAAMRTCLERISEYARWDFGRVAILKAGTEVPVVESSLWLTADTKRYDDFVRVSENYDYSELTGKFVSVTMREKRPVWVEDFSNTNPQGRLRDALKAGLRSGFTFPIIVQGEVAAFLEFFAQKPRKADPLLLDAVGSVGAQLARLIERARAQAVDAQLAAIVEASHDAIFSRALDGTVLSWNAGAERVFGYTAAEMIGRHISIIAPPALAHESQRNTEILLRGEPAPPFETVRIAKGGREVQVEVSVSPIRDRSGEVTAIAAIMRDVTANKRAETERTQLAAIVESSQDAIVSTASDRTVVTWNTGAERIFGYTAAEAVGRDVGFLVPDDLRHELGHRRALALEGRAVPPHDSERLSKDGRRVPVSISASPLRDGAGDISGVALIYRDISESKRAEAAQARLAAIVENSDDAIISRSLDRVILTWNAAAERLFGWSTAEAIGRSIAIMVPPEREGESARYREMVHRGEPVPMYDTERLTKEGRRIHVSLSQSAIKDADGRIIGVSLIFRDIAERKEAEEKIRLLAHYDGLTGLPNRALFYDRLGQTIALARRDEHAVGLLYLDLDGFKAVNDRLGHDAGDELLKAVAERMKWLLRESDTIARVGGDEFIAILPKIANREHCMVVAKKLLEAFSPPFRLGSAQREAVIGASIGIAVFPLDAEDLESLVKAADSAMYCAKQAGIRFSFYEKPQQP
jgi:diguanylate cyclase (GGDEF)-like protein/PAS domain S-box-containing protein